MTGGYVERKREERRRREERNAARREARARKKHQVPPIVVSEYAELIRGAHYEKLTPERAAELSLPYEEGTWLVSWR